MAGRVATDRVPERQTGARELILLSWDLDAFSL